MQHLYRFVSIPTSFLLNPSGSIQIGAGCLVIPPLSPRQSPKTRLGLGTISLALIALSALCGPVWADGSGTITYLGHTAQLKYAYAFRHPYLSDKTKQAVTLALADRPFDTAALNDSPVRETELHRQLAPSELNMVEITLAPEGAYSMIAWQAGGERSGFGLDWYKFDVKQIDDTHIVGTLHSKHDSDGQSDKGSSPLLTPRLDLQFAIDFPGPPNFGTALPADGGEPGKVYLAYNTALDKGDLDALGKAWDRERSNWLQDRRKNNDSKDIVRNLQMTYLLPQPKINKAFVTGDKATLFVSGEDIDRHESEFIVFLHQEDGRWHVGDMHIDHRPAGAGR
jgi:hypothetical protein